jgi:hypothetical protein
MQTRFRAAATALLLTATAGAAAAAGGPAQASGSHTSHRAAQLVITIKTTPKGIALSDSKVQPGNTIFKILPHGKGGDMQVLRLKAGYTLKQAFKDFGAAFAQTPDVKAVRRIDRKVLFYGGNAMAPKGGRANFWGVDLDRADTYYVLNVDSNALTPLKVAGAHQKRGLPAKDGWVNPADASDGVTNIWKVGQHNANKGWMSTTNHAKEPHFVDLTHVKKSTTNQQISDCFAGGACDFVAADGAATSAGVISPGKKFVWTYRLPKGRYVVDCFWPSKTDGTPHALMGMFKLLNLG